MAGFDMSVWKSRCVEVANPDGRLEIMITYKESECSKKQLSCSITSGANNQYQWFNTHFNTQSTYDYRAMRNKSALVDKSTALAWNGDLAGSKPDWIWLAAYRNSPFCDSLVLIDKKHEVVIICLVLWISIVWPTVSEWRRNIASLTWSLRTNYDQIWLIDDRK